MKAVFIVTNWSVMVTHNDETVVKNFSDTLQHNTTEFIPVGEKWDF